MKNVVLILFVGLLTTGFTQETKAPKVQTIEVKTSAICGECKERIENTLNFTKGVKFAELDLETNIITIKYKTADVTDVQIKKIIADIGYHADEVERSGEAFKNLPGCCQDPNAKCAVKKKE